MLVANKGEYIVVVTYSVHSLLISEHIIYLDHTELILLPDFCTADGTIIFSVYANREMPNHFPYSAVVFIFS